MGTLRYHARRTAQKPCIKDTESTAVAHLWACACRMDAVVAHKDKFIAAVKKFKEERLKEQIWESALKMILMVGAFAASKESRDGFTLVEMVQSFQDIKGKLDALENGERDPKSGMRIVPPKNQTGRAFVMALPGGLLWWRGSSSRGGCLLSTRSP